MQGSVEAIRQQEQFDAASHIKANIGVRLGYYSHPLAAEITRLIDSTPATPLQQEGLEASRGSLEVLATKEAEQARVKFADSVKREYPNVYINDVKQAVPGYDLLDQHAVAEECVSSRQNLLQAVSHLQPETNVAEIVSEDELSKAADQVRQENINRVIEQTDYIAQALVMRQGRIGSMVLNVLRKDLFEPLPTRSSSANLHRALQSLLDSASILLNSELFGEQVAAKFRRPIVDHTHSTVRQACSDLTEQALSGLINQLKTIDPRDEPAELLTDSQHEVNNTSDLATDDVGDDSDKIEEGSVDSSIGQWSAGNNYRAIETARTDGTKTESELTPRLAVTSVGAAKKVGSKGSQYYFDELALATKEGEPTLEDLRNALLDSDYIKKWLETYPGTLADVSNLIDLLLTSPNAQGSEYMRRAISVVMPGENVAKKVRAKRLNPRHTLTVGQGFTSKLTEQLRIFYFYAEYSGQKSLVIFNAGNKSNFTGQFERHM